MDKDFEIDDRGSNCRNDRSGYFIRYFCAGFLILICAVVILSIFYSIFEKPVEIGPISFLNKTEVNSSTTMRETVSFSSNPNYVKFTLAELFSGKRFLRESYEFVWLPDGSFVYESGNNLTSESHASRVFPMASNPEFFLDNFEYSKSLSSDQKYVSLSQNVKTVFRHSSERLYKIVKLNNGSILRDVWNVGLEEDAIIQAFHWNPKNNSHDFVFVHKYNLYYQSDPENQTTVIQLTSNGTFLERFGIPNWLYEEEILEGGSAVTWSSSGRYVSYLKFDDQLVNKIFLPSYTNDDQYVEYTELPYPKAGVIHNTLVTQFIWDIKTHKIVETAPPNGIGSRNESYYIFRHLWIKMPSNAPDLGAERLVTVWANRDQNEVYFSLCNEQDCIMTFSQAMKIGNRSLWAEPQEVGCIHQTEYGFLTILPHNYDDNIYNHVAHIELDSAGTGKITQWIGKDFDIVSIVGYSLKQNTLVVHSYGKEIGEVNNYVITDALHNDSNELKKISDLIPDCVTSSVASMNPTGERLMVQCQEPFENTKLYLLDINNTSKQILLSDTQKAHLPFDKPSLKYGKFKLSSGIDGHYMMMIPPNLKNGKKLPLLLDLYGGPNSKKVMKKTPSAHLIQICSQHETIVVNVDVSGTAGRGWNIKEPVFKHLGEMEMQDTLEMIQHFIQENNFIDENRIAVMGWSYGGFLATKIAIKDQGELIRCAIAISPVTNFKYYDTAYTERYLGQPADNVQGYEDTNLIPNAKNLTAVKYLLAHGEKDDNVHFQNSAIWSEALQLEGVHYTQLTYANEAHNLIGKIQHLYQEIDFFLEHECFLPSAH